MSEIETDPIALGPGGEPVYLELSMANRHGLVAGATGTGKTVTLQSLVERFCRAGVSVLAADVKGDLSGLAARGGGNPRVEAALAAAALAVPGLAGRPREALRAAFWDPYGEGGVPLRATVSDMGPLLLGRALGLSEVQREVLSILFRVADERGLELVDLKDLRALIEWAGAAAALLEPSYGRMSGASLSALQRAVVVLEGQGGGLFFGEPALDVNDLLARGPDGRGLASLLSAGRLVDSPTLYSAFLLWLLSELFEELPEAGDLPAPKLVLFFDEAHLLFDGADEELTRSVLRTVRLIRSKGVGVWFVTQNPQDLPEEVLAQLGNRVQHALRAYTPKEARALKAAAESFRQRPGLDAEAALGELGIGEALVSFLDTKGAPVPVQRVRIVPPLSRVGPLGPEERSALVAASPAMARYGRSVDRTSAYERLRGEAPPGAAGAGPAPRAAPGPASLEDAMADLEAELRGETPPSRARAAAQAAPRRAAEGPDWGEPAEPSPARGTARAAPGRGSAGRAPASGEELLGSLATSALRAAGNELGRQLVRGLLGGRSGSSRRRRRC
ncbi:MAG TPA: DUF853 family protein [Spirochaetales bacterium]|nr:DUF853 family protein [Spirochaetales bacterium]